MITARHPFYNIRLYNQMALKYFCNDFQKNSIKSQYHALLLQLHPDKGGDDTQFREMQKEYDMVKFLYGSTENAENESWADAMEDSDDNSKVIDYQS